MLDFSEFGIDLGSLDLANLDISNIIQDLLPTDNNPKINEDEGHQGNGLPDSK